MSSIREILGDAVPVPVIETDGRAIVLDLSSGSVALGDPLMGMTVGRFTERVQEKLREGETGFAYGRWGERRELYVNEHFLSHDPVMRRDVHLGVDIFCEAGTPIRAPLPGTVYLAANNARELDYGPMLILRHETDGGSFYTLYGHLSSDSTSGLEPGQAVQAGDVIATVGAPPENGNWSPHLHFQLILDLLGLDANFPGVCSYRDRAKWFALSPLPAEFVADIDASVLDGSEPV